MFEKKIGLFILLITVIMLSGCNNNSTLVENNNIKSNKDINVYTLDKKEIKQKEFLIKELNNLLNKKDYLIEDKEVNDIKKNIVNKNLNLLQVVLAINNIKEELFSEEKILKTEEEKNRDKKIKNIWFSIEAELSLLQNNNLYKSNFLNIKNSLNDLIKKHYYTEGYFLLLNNKYVKNICSILDRNNIDKKDDCYFTLSKNYNINLCLDIENKKIQQDCFIYKKQYLGYKQFKSIEECLLDNNVKNRIGNIEGCFEYFYDKKYEKILDDLNKDKKLLNLINKQYKNIVILDFVKKYAKIMKDENICKNFYKKNKEKLKQCELDTIISIFKESNNIKWLNKIKDKALRKYLILQYYPDIISYNSLNELGKNNICKEIKDTKEYNNCNDLYYFKEVRETYRSIDMTKEKLNEGDKICEKIKKNNIKQNCKNYIQTSYQIKIGMEEK